MRPLNGGLWHTEESKKPLRRILRRSFLHLKNEHEEKVREVATIDLVFQAQVRGWQFQPLLAAHLVKFGMWAGVHLPNSSCNFNDWVVALPPNFAIHFWASWRDGNLPLLERELFLLRAQVCLTSRRRWSSRCHRQHVCGRVFVRTSSFLNYLMNN